MAYAQFSSPEALYGTMFMEISKLSPRERHIILDVMLRDENLRRKDEHRVRRMKSELLELRRRGALRPSEDCPVGDARTCNRCRAELGWIVNRGAVCQACRLRVCKACREYSVRTVDWVCTVCYKRSQIQTATGEWMNEFMRKPGQWKDNKFYVSAADIIKSTIRRSWTICDPNTRWPSRDSPNFRPYNSLPRGRDVSDYPSLNGRGREDCVMKNSPSSDSLLNDTLLNATTTATATSTVDTTETTTDETDNLGENYALKQRRVSQFERTLSELYGTRKKSIEIGISVTSPSADSSSTSANGTVEIKKVPELKPSKIPSPRKKIQYTRSETSAVCETPKQQIRKHNSLQSTKKYTSKEKSTELSVDKRVSFDDENSTGKSPNIIQKSGIPKRDLKSRNSIKNESRDESQSHDKDPPPSEKVIVEEKISKCDLPEVHHEQIEMVSDDAEVEQLSGTVFRKVTIKKRRHDFKKTQAFDDGSLRRKHRCSESTTRDDLLDADTGRILLPDGDDYRLVFISSDSSSKEEDVDDNDSVSSSSATTGHSFTIDDCDWDYFEPSSGVKPVLCWSNRNSPFGSPRVYRRSVLDSPLGSPLVYRRTRESDTGTDEDVTRIDSGSPASSDSVVGFLSRIRTPSETEDHLPMDSAGLYVEHQQHLQCVMHRGDDTSEASITSVHSTSHNANSQVSSPSTTPLLRPPCQSCGSIAPTPITQFVPIPVLVPIPVPVPAVWNPLDPVILYNTSDTLDGNLRARLRAIQQRTGAFLWPCVNQASLISSLISPGGDGNSLLRVEHSMYSTPTETDVSKTETSSMPAASERNNVPTDSTALDQHTIGEYEREAETNETSSNGSNNRRVSSTYHELNTEVPMDIHTDRDSMNTEGETTNRTEPATDNQQCAVVEAAAATEVSSHVSIDGYLVSDNTFMSSSEYSNSSDMEHEDEDVRKPRVRRMYRVNGGNARESDDALPSSDCDDDDDDTGRMSQSSERNDDLYSSETIDTDSDDTGTVADKKTKKFSKVFVVNTNDSSSDIEDNTDSCSSSSDSSDNDTDTEMDCVILNYMKPLDDTSTVETNNSEAIDPEEDSVVLLKHVKSNEPDEYNCAGELKSERDSVENSDKNKVENSAEDTTESGVVLLKHVTFNMFTEDSIDNNDSNNSDSDNISDNSVSASIDNNNTSVKQKINRTISHKNYTAEERDVKWRAESKLSNHSTAHPVDLSTDQYEEYAVHSDTAASSTEHTGHRTDNTPAPQCERSTELIGDQSAPTTDCIASVSEESKQTAIDLETLSEPSPSDTKVNDQSTTYAKPHKLSSTNAIDIPPPGTIVTNEQSDANTSGLHCLSSNDHIDTSAQQRALSANSDICESAMTENNNNSSTEATVSNNEHTHSSIRRSNNKSSAVLQCHSEDNNDITVFPQEEKFIAGIDKQSEVSTNEESGSNRSEWNTSAGIRSSDPVRWPSDTDELGCARRGVKGDAASSVRGARTGALSTVDNETSRHVPAARYTSLVMITQEPPPSVAHTSPSSNVYPQVSIVASDTTTIVPTVATNSDVIVRHTNWQDRNTDHALTLDTCESNNSDTSGLAGYFALALESPSTGGRRTGTPRKPVLVTKTSVNSVNDENITVVTNSDIPVATDSECNTNGVCDDGVTVVTGGDTLSAVVCLEEGLADDDSWVEDISHDEDEFATTTATDSSSGEEVMLSSSLDQEEELRGYNRTAIDFTLHTIVEESCEESEVEQSQANNKTRPTSATDLEKYFFFRLGDGSIPNVNSNREETLSETSSIYSEGIDSLGTTEDIINDGIDPAELASSRLEKYFLSGFTSFTAERRDSDGSVGSDSEGRPSPEQRRKRLVRARGTGRSHSSSLDNLLTNAELSGAEPQSADSQQLASEDSSSSETDTYDEHTSNFEKSDGQFDTVKRKKGKKQRGISGGSSSPHDEKKLLETTMEETNENKDSGGDDDGHKTPQPEYLISSSGDVVSSRKQQSRDSGFIGSCDDLLKEQKTSTDFNTSKESSSITKSFELKNDLEKITEEKRTTDEKIDKPQHNSIPPATSLTRKDSFNNWSSDEETNLMMSKMRQFFKTMVANNSNTHINPSSKPTTPVLTKHSPLPVPSPRAKNRNKPPQLVYFENELTRLMKTVPGIRDDQVREIVEYLSSEDTWSDSYDSSDYTSSDLEGTTVAQKSALQEQISASCQQIINKFDKNADDEEGDRGDGGIMDESQGLNRETTIVYQKLVASLNKMTADEQSSSTNKQHNPYNSPPLIAKVMHHIGSRLVALMHEVSSGESHCSISPKIRHHHRRLQQKLSSASTTTTEDDDSTSDSNLPDCLTELEESGAPYNLLPRSRSHDLLLGEARAHHQSSSGVSDIAEEREASDYERFSWRGSFESALMATDSRTKLSLLGAEGSASASALVMAAKRRSAGDLLFSPKSLSREQLDRVRSCGSIGGGSNSEEKHWVVTPAVRPNRRRSSVPDATCGSGGSADGEDDDEEDLKGRSTLPRSLQTNTATTNSLPRLPTTATAANMHKAQSMHHFLQHTVKSARYRPPGFNRSNATVGPKRAVSAPGLQPSHPRRETRRRSQQPHISSDDVSITESNSSPIVGPKSGSKSASPSPIHGNTLTRGTGSVSSADWQSNDDDIDRLVAMHQNRSSLSSLGLRSDSMASVYSGAGEGRYGIVAVRGQVEFGLQYNYKAGALEIHVKQCRDLAPVDVKRNRSDPYVKVYLLPDKSKSGKRKTKVKKHTLNPAFDECLKFHLSLSGLETRTLWLTVWHSDMFGRNDFLGEVMMPLENKVFDDPTPKWYNLQERTEPFEELPSYKGDIIIGLKFVPPDMTVQKKGKRSRGALHVLVKEAKNLIAVKANGTSDPFCKSYLLPDKGRSNKQKTPILRRTTSPVWNHNFVYDDVTLQELAERALELTVWDHDRLASNEFLGGVRFSLGTNKHYGKNVDWMDASGKEMSLWQSMLERPNFWVEGCVSLRSSLDNRTT